MAISGKSTKKGSLSQTLLIDDSSAKRALYSSVVVQDVKIRSQARDSEGAIK